MFTSKKSRVNDTEYYIVHITQEVPDMVVVWFKRNENFSFQGIFLILIKIKFKVSEWNGNKKVNF
jgi:hypothetical protein